MIDIYVLDKNLEMVGILDAYQSLIWANRYTDLGDCEVYLPAMEDNIALCQKGYYLMRTDDNMVCRINRLEISTDADEGNYLAVYGTDVKNLCDQRVIWGTLTCSGNLETFIRKMVATTLGATATTERRLKKENGQTLLILGSSSGLTAAASFQVSYVNVGAKIRELCLANGWGYRIVRNGTVLQFQVYAGTDRSASVIFSNDFENLASTHYSDDLTKLGNVAMIGGAGEGSERATAVFGQTEGTERWEIFVDAKDISRQISWKDLTETYPASTGTIVSYSGKYGFRVDTLDVQIVGDDHLEWLQENYPGGTVVTVDGSEYYRLSNTVIATMDTNSPQDSTTVTLEDVIYHGYLLSRGEQNLAEYGEIVTFEGAVIPDITFVYKQDYYLGDIVTVRNEYGITAAARIVEVVEVLDENGYSVEPKFEYITQN